MLLRVTAATAMGLVMAVEAAAQAPDPTRAAAELRTSFEHRLAAIAEGLDGVMGFSIVDLTTGDRFGRLADEPFPTASSIKIAILYELFKQAEEGRLKLDEPRPVPQAARAAGIGILQELTAPSMPLTDYATLMVVLSDNTATNLLIDALGMDRVNARMRALGLAHVWLQRQMIDAEAARRGLENLAWPNDLAALLDAVHRPRTGPASRDGSWRSSASRRRRRDARGAAWRADVSKPGRSRACS
jgi:beta-lactamase class A